MQMGTGINPANLQEMLDSASNAAARGQAQFFTPIWLGELIGEMLGPIRPHICDLSSGAGHLLIGTCNSTTKVLMGVDIDPVRTTPSKKPHPSINKIVGDIADVAPMLHKIRFECGTIVLNPPWSLNLPKEKFDFLLDANIHSVRVAYRQIESKSIDATAALILSGLHFSTHDGDLVVIANGATIDRFFDRGPLANLRHHIWARIDAVGNLMTDSKQDNWGNDFTTTILFMAKGHAVGCRYHPEICKDMDALKKAFKGADRYEQRGAPELFKEHRASQTTEPYFWAVKEEVETLAAAKAKRPGGYNIYLTKDGTIGTYLSVYTTRAGVVDTKLANELHSLGGKTPLQLVMQREQRQALTAAINGTTWRVDPQLPKLVDAAIRDYHSIRAPMYPLSKVQCLGYLDEENSIVCSQDFLPWPFAPSPDTAEQLDEFVKNPCNETWDQLYSRMSYPGGRTFWQLALKIDEKFKNGHRFDTDLIGVDGPIPYKPCDKDEKWRVIPNPRFFVNLRKQVPMFRAGKKYEIRTQTLTVKSSKWKPGLDGDDKEYVLTGQELAIYIKDEEGVEQCFLDSRHSHKEVLDERARAITRRFLGLDDLVEHFVIPSVPDVGTIDSERYGHYQNELQAIEATIGYRLKRFQMEDIARGAMHDGIISAWDTGLGKTWKTFLWPLIKVGRIDGTCLPKEPVLIVAPEGLHKQIIKTGKRFFGVKEIIPLDSQDTYYKLSPLKPGWYITSFTQLASNKILKLPHVVGGGFDEIARQMKFFSVTLEDVKKCKLDTTLSFLDKALELCRRQRELYELGIGESKDYDDGRRIKCVYSPALADLCNKDFAAVVIDEAVKVKGADSVIGLGVRSMQPRFRLVLTATPIKNRLPDIFWLAWWATGGKGEAHARWPYKGTTEDQAAFASEFLISEVSKDDYAAGTRKKRQKRGKATAEVCNIHRLWKLLAPVLVRRRKRDIGEEIVQKIRKPMYVPMGKHQAATYAYHLAATYKNINGQKDLLSQMTALRNCAAAPHTSLLCSKDKDGPYKSDYSYIPKIAATLKVIRDCMARGEQVAVFSAFTEPLDTLKRRLEAAGVEFLYMTGEVDAGIRGTLSAKFSEGRPNAPVVLAGIKAMAEGHDWPLANNVVLFAYDWAYDLFEQAINRVHRLNSIMDVNVWAIMCENSIDLKLESLIREKGDSAELVLDGKLVTDQTSEVNFAKLLEIANEAFATFNKANVVDEEVLEKDWDVLREELRKTYKEYKLMPPIERKAIQAAPPTPPKEVVAVKPPVPKPVHVVTPPPPRPVVASVPKPAPIKLTRDTIFPEVKEEPKPVDLVPAGIVEETLSGPENGLFLQW